MNGLLSAINGVGAVTIVTVIFGISRGIDLPGWQRQVLQGCVLGLAAALVMLQPIALSDGTSFGAGNLLVAFAALFLSPVGGGAALLIAVTACLGLQSPTLVSDLAALSLAVLIGGLWAPTSPASRSPTWFAGFGAQISVAATASALFFGTLSLSAALPLHLLADMSYGVIAGALLSRDRNTAERERALADAARIDPLTGLLNRRGFETAYDSLRKREGARMALLLVDLDKFKEVNDCYGHAAGDEILGQVASIMVRSVDKMCRVARIGGEEFAILVPNALPADAFLIAEKVRRSIGAETFLYLDSKLRVSASVGVSCETDSFPDLRKSFLTADRCLYAAKRAGRDRTVLNMAA